MGRRTFWVVAVILLCAGAAWGKKSWTEVRSEHFRVISDGDLQGALDIAREFEQMRAVFAAGSVNMRLDSGVPFLVLATRNAATMAEVMSWPKANGTILGLFEPGWEKQFAVVRIDADSPGFYQPAFHEYVHTLIHANFHWLPLWLDEGLAEFYGTAEFKQNSALIGEPSQRKFILKREQLIDLKTLLSVNQASPYYHDSGKVDIFYAEAWGLTHYLTFGEGMGRGQKLSQFYASLEAGADQEEAFKQIFGPLDQVQVALADYVGKGKMQAWEFNNPPHIIEHDFAVRKLTPAETEAELGAFSVWGTHNFKDASKMLTEAIQDDPKSATAHEALGFLNFDEGKDDEALREFKLALESDNGRYLSLFAETMLSVQAHSDHPEDRAALENAMFRVLQGNSQFAPAYVQLALLYAREGNLKSATGAANMAVKLQPSRAGYELLKANLLLQGGRAKEAGSIAKYVADRWQGPDRDEAVDLWNKVPDDQRTALKEETAKEANGVQKIDGIVKSTVCAADSPEHKYTVTLNHDGKDVVFRTSKGFEVGFSDMLWYGRDHFSACHHIEGMRAIIGYRPGDGKAPAADLVELELRVDVPVPERSAPQQQATSN
jgi:tetratricopeptide (TPR) repeat protein